MKKDFTIAIYNKGVGNKDIHGSYVPGAEGFVKNIDCDIQPYSRQLLLKQYGYDIEVNKRIFIDEYEDSIKIGTTFKYVNKQNKTETYEVKAIPWDDKYMEVVCLGI